jgi:hypothetical protein
VKDATGQSLAYVSPRLVHREHGGADSLSLAGNIAKLPTLLSEKNE